MTTTKKTLVSSLTALTLGAALIASAAPAQAKSWKYHHGHGGVVAAGVIGGLALGALAAASAPAYATPVYYAPTCYKARQAVTNAFGTVLYYRTVRVCE